ncbi:MAG: type IV secretion system DNA-binding domain-containing protein [Alphaproteobacteria bacterium]|nr:type IV secretion system DNA-binding domain-containing protein [Alphaproteobacteria bacterium]
MSITNNFVRGGQLSLHKYQMIKQVSLVTVLLCFLVSVMATGILFFSKTTSYERYLYTEYLQAEFQTTLHFSDVSQATQNFEYQNGMKREVRSSDILQNPSIQHVVHDLNDLLEKSFYKALYYALFFLVLTVSFFGYRGYKKSQKTLERGNRLIGIKDFIKLIHKRNEASDLLINELPLVKDSETTHILVTGTTGAGKTNLINGLLPQIAERGNRAFVIDTTGDMVSKYYNPDRGDIIINPFDSRSHDWDIIHECDYEFQYDNMSKAVVPQNNNMSEPMWRDASALTFSAALQKARREGLSPKEIHKILFHSTLKEYGRFFKGTDAFIYADPAGEKTTMSFRSTLTTNVQFLKHLGKNRPKFKISDWMKDDNAKSWVFVTANEDMIGTLNSLIAAMFSSATTMLMTKEECFERRVWFVMDELPAVQKLRALEPILSKGRKYGACVLAGLQGMSQFNDIYGQNGAKTILNLFNTKFFFRFNESEAADYLSCWLGEEEVEEFKENLSYGAHQMRDGVSLNEHKSIKKLVLPTEILRLPNMQCYVMYPGDYPISKLKTSINKIEVQHKPFEIQI